MSTHEQRTPGNQQAPASGAPTLEFSHPESVSATQMRAATVRPTTTPFGTGG